MAGSIPDSNALVKPSSTVYAVQASSSSAAPATDDWPFPFERLPKDVRWMVYEYLSEPVFQKLLNEDQGLYYEAWKMPVALLQVNKFFHEEVKDCILKHLNTRPIVLLCRQETPYLNDPLNYAGTLVHLISNGHKCDNRSQQGHQTDDRLSRDFDKWTLKVPMMIFETEIGRICSTLDIPLVSFHRTRLQNFYRSSSVKLRCNANREINVRYFLKDFTTASVAAAKSIKRNVSRVLEARHYPRLLATLLVQSASSAALLRTHTDGDRSGPVRYLVESPTEVEIGLLSKQS